MPDIFLSYNREDQAVARCYAEAFTAEGFEVWWDVTLRSGEAYDQVTEKALKTAKAVVVLWSPRSVESRWVRAEATLADRNKTLLPATIEPCERPIMFELTQTAELTHWRGEADDKTWLAFLADVKRFVANGRVGQGQASAPASKERPAAPADLSIAVLPFVNMSADAEQEYFSDGLTEELLNQLAQMKELRVIGRTSCFAFKGKNEDLRVIGQKLDVAHILEGSVRKAGNRLRITAQLVKCADHTHLWSQTYDRQLDDVFAIQDDVARAVADALKITLGVGAQTHAPGGTRNVEAYDLYLRGCAIMQDGSHATNLRAADMLRRAVTLDPQFANGWLRLAEALSISLNFGVVPAVREERNQALDRVVEIAPDLWAGHVARASKLVWEDDLLGADQAYDRAIELAPKPFPEVGTYTMFIGGLGRILESLPLFAAIRQADPLRPVPTFQMFLCIAGRYAEAEGEYARIKEMAVGPLQLGDWFDFAKTLATEERAAAKKRLAGFLANSPAPPVLNEELLAVFDDPDAALAWIRGKVDDPPPELQPLVILFAFLAAHFCDAEYALQLLRRVYIDMGRAAPIVNIWHPVFAEVRKLPAFKDFTRELGLYGFWRASGRWGDFARPVGDDDFEIIR